MFIQYHSFFLHNLVKTHHGLATSLLSWSIMWPWQRSQTAVVSLIDFVDLAVLERSRHSLSWIRWLENNWETGVAKAWLVFVKLTTKTNNAIHQDTMHGTVEPRERWAKGNSFDVVFHVCTLVDRSSLRTLLWRMGSGWSPQFLPHSFASWRTNKLCLQVSKR